MSILFAENGIDPGDILRNKYISNRVKEGIIQFWK